MGRDKKERQTDNTLKSFPLEEQKKSEAEGERMVKGSFLFF